MAYTAGNLVCLDVEYIDGSANPVDPPDARYDVIDPTGLIVEANVPTTVVVTGRHRGCFQTSASSPAGTWKMRFKGTIDDIPSAQDCTFVLVAPDESTYGPCESWPVDNSCCSFPVDASGAVIQAQTAVATRLLWAESGRIYGPCPVPVRPCLERCSGSSWPILHTDPGSSWSSWCGCRNDCSCTSLCEIVLPGPVSGVQSVKIDGETLDASLYRFYQLGRQWRLTRTDSECWPSCQDLRVGPDEVGSFVVTYFQGLPLDEAAIAAHSELACELVKACVPSCKDCRLPTNVISKARNGVTLSFDADVSWIRTLPAVKAWLDSVNPAGLSRPMRVLSPDARGPRRG